MTDKPKSLADEHVKAIEESIKVWQSKEMESYLLFRPMEAQTYGRYRKALQTLLDQQTTSHNATPVTPDTPDNERR